MKFSAILCLLIIFACGCKRDNMQQLLSEQKLLKDSAFNLNARTYDYVSKGLIDKAEAEKLQVGAVYARLIAIQSSLDNLEKVKK